MDLYKNAFEKAHTFLCSMKMVKKNGQNTDTMLIHVNLDCQNVISDILKFSSMLRLPLYML